MNTKKEVTQTFEELKEGSESRNFVQTVDLIINIEGVDLSDPENRFSTDVILPSGRGKEREICVIGDSKLSEAEELGVNVLSESDLDDLEGERDEAKKIAEENDFFLAEAPLMQKIGKILGPVLGPRGKMPNPFPPGADLEELIQRSEKSLTVKLGEEPVLQFPVGTEEMKPSEVEENVQAVLDEIGDNLPKGPQQIGSVYLKFTMSSPVEVI